MNSASEMRWGAGEFFPWGRRQRFLVGVSGGVDSVVLLHTLLESGYKKLVVCHLDHGLRGRASTADAAWVGRLADQLGVECVREKVEVSEWAKERKVSVETGGRLARHEFFARMARRYRCQRLFLAHHADDQAETVLMNVCRGSAGWVGMKVETMLEVPGFRAPLRVLRPFLSMGKAEIRQMARSRGWRFREDASNLVGNVVRNRVRLEVMPLLNEIFQRETAPALVRAAAWNEAARGFLEQAAAGWSGQEKLGVAELAGVQRAGHRRSAARVANSST